MKQYNREDLTVIWEPELCIHSRKCFTGLKEVFNPQQRPWINLDAATKERIMDQVQQCPSGALSYELHTEKLTAENATVTEDITVEVTPNGPLMVYGNITIKHKSGKEEHKNKVTAFCRCGMSANKPFCDGTHARNGFKDE